MRNGTNGEHGKSPNNNFLRVSRQSRRIELEMPKIPGMIRARNPGIEISIMRFAVGQIADITKLYRINRLYSVWLQAQNG